MKKIQKLQVVLFLSLIVMFCVGCGDTKYKDYIIDHADEIRWDIELDSNYYVMDSCEYDYYTDVTIRMINDSAYTVIFWGDRDSWLWRHKLDKHFTVDVPYNRSKGKGVATDMFILYLLGNSR